MAVIESVVPEHAHGYEVFWIGYFNTLNAPLLNGRHGTHTVTLPITPSQAARIRQLHAAAFWPVHGLASVADLHPLIITHILNGSLYPDAGGPIRGRDYFTAGEFHTGKEECDWLDSFILGGTRRHFLLTGEMQ